MSAREPAIASRPLMQELFASGLYKQKQGRLVRQITCLTIWGTVAIGAWRAHATLISPLLGDENRAIAYILSVALGCLGFWIGYRLVNWPTFADFLISVEAELNKVSWPTRRELVQASIVVIFTILFLSGILFVYDAIWKFLFGLAGIA